MNMVVILQKADFVYYNDSAISYNIHGVYTLGYWS